MKSTAKYQVWMSGGGTQSWAIAALIVQGKLPKPDFAVISDTEREKGTTWDYMSEDGKPMQDLRNAGINLIRIQASQWANQGTELYYRNGRKLVKIPAISFDSGEPQRMTNFCTTDWKIEPIDRWLSKEHGVTRSKYVKWLGFSKDEPRRWIRKMKTDEYKKGLIRLPLVNEVPTSRAECSLLVQGMGWPTPPRSACWCCPNQNDDEWAKLRKESPDEFTAAIEIDKLLRIKDPNLYLHKSGKPLSEVTFEAETESDLFTRPCDSGVCFV